MVVVVRKTDRDTSEEENTSRQILETTRGLTRKKKIAQQYSLKQSSSSTVLNQRKPRRLVEVRGQRTDWDGRSGAGTDDVQTEDLLGVLGLSLALRHPSPITPSPRPHKIDLTMNMPPIILPSTTAAATLLAIAAANLSVPLLAFTSQQQFHSRSTTFDYDATLDSPSQSILPISCSSSSRSSNSFGRRSSTSIISPTCLLATSSSSSNKQRRASSTVIDPHGPTPHREPDPFPEIDLDSLPEAHYDDDNHPIPHQPWRRGDTDGCHEPINAPWRLEAESIISDAVHLVGGSVADVTWYMAKCVISLDSKSFANVIPYIDGPEVRIVYPDSTDISGHVFVDPEAGSDEEMFTEEDELLDYEQYDEDTEYEILKSSMPIEYDEATGMELPPREPRSRVERVMEMQEEYESRNQDEGRVEKPSDGLFSHPVNTKALSVISQAIMKALSEEDVENRLRILSRHDVILTSPLDSPVVLDSQKEFDYARNLDVYVETRDPWGSNRVLGGKLVDRNAMDVIINQDNSGRMVTIPNSMIHQVLLPSGLAKGSARMKAGMDGIVGEEEEEDEDEDYYEEGGDYGEGDEDDDDGDDEEYLDVEEEEVFE